MSLAPVIDILYTNPEAKAACNAILDAGSSCQSIIEIGSRGGVSGIAALQALCLGKKTWRPSLTCVDLIHDETIVKLQEFSEALGIFFQFLQGHSADLPLFEADGLLWDSFHTAANLCFDLDRISPWIHKYIFILGIKVHGLQSEAVQRGLDLENTAKELRVSSANIEKGLIWAVEHFLESHPEWSKVNQIGELIILKRVSANPQWLFS
jgi:hypothetical protein